jgi:DUF4097 and DUF4098 domain-containing protein YvlB
MKTRSSISLLLLTLAASATAFAANGTFNRTLTVSGPPTVSIATGSGYLHITAGSASEVRIQAKVSTENGWSFGLHGSENERVQQILSNPPIVQNGNAITIGATNGNSSDLLRNIQIDYDVTLPAATTLKALTGSGDIQIAHINSVVYVQTGSGDIQLNDIGPAPHVGTGSGSIRAEGVHGAASLETGSGDIELQQQAPGDVKAQTGSGSLRLHGVNGALRAGTGSGDVEIDGNPTSDWRLSTGSGTVRVGLNPSAHYTVNASTSSGDIHVGQHITLQESLDKQHIVGTVNGGGPTLRITTSSGDIDLR